MVEGPYPCLVEVEIEDDGEVADEREDPGGRFGDGCQPVDVGERGSSEVSIHIMHFSGATSPDMSSPGGRLDGKLVEEDGEEEGAEGAACGGEGRQIAAGNRGVVGSCRQQSIGSLALTFGDKVGDVEDELGREGHEGRGGGHS